jgi:preprotein translocase subunit SecA
VAVHASGDPLDWDLGVLLGVVRSILPVPPDLRPGWKDMSAEQIEQQLLAWSEQAYSAKEQQLGSEVMRQLERLLMLHTVDTLWVRHLTALDELREGIGLRAFAQRDPLVEYKREAFDTFEELKTAIGGEVAHRIFFASVQRQPARREMRAYRPGAEARSKASARAKAEKVGRNDPCPCGSGRKYKNCCMHKELATQSGAASAAPDPRAQPQARPVARHHTSRKKRR